MSCGCRFGCAYSAHLSVLIGLILLLIPDLVSIAIATTAGESAECFSHGWNLKQWLFYDGITDASVSLLVLIVLVIFRLEIPMNGRFKIFLGAASLMLLLLSSLWILAWIGLVGAILSGVSEECKTLEPKLVSMTIAQIVFNIVALMRNLSGFISSTE